MPIRKGKTRLHRPCRRCQEMFEPHGRASWLCDKCSNGPGSRGTYLQLLAKKYGIRKVK